MACFIDVDVRMMWNDTIVTATRFTATESGPIETTAQ